MSNRDLIFIYWSWTKMNSKDKRNFSRYNDSAGGLVFEGTLFSFDFPTSTLLSIKVLLVQWIFLNFLISWFFDKNFENRNQNITSQTNINEHKSSRKPLEPKILQLKRSTSPQHKLHMFDSLCSVHLRTKKWPQEIYIGCLFFRKYISILIFSIGLNKCK